MPVDPLSTDDSRKRLTAYHEAGHAVMALLQGRNVHRVSIVPKQSRLGDCQLRKDVARVAKDPLEAEALVLLAGLVGEAKYSGRYNPQAAGSDLLQVQRLAIQRVGEAGGVERQVKRWLDKTEHLLSDAPYELAIRTIAEQLLQRERISGRNARHHFNEAVSRHERDNR